MARTGRRPRNLLSFWLGFGVGQNQPRSDPTWSDFAQASARHSEPQTEYPMAHLCRNTARCAGCRGIAETSFLNGCSRTLVDSLAPRDDRRKTLLAMRLYRRPVALNEKRLEAARPILPGMALPPATLCNVPHQSTAPPTQPAWPRAHATHQRPDNNAAKSGCLRVRPLHGDAPFQAWQEPAGTAGGTWWCGADTSQAAMRTGSRPLRTDTRSTGEAD